MSLASSAVPQQLFEVASKISTPLGLAGFFAAALFFIFNRIVQSNFFPKLTQAVGGRLLENIVNKLFILALVAMILGFVGFALVRLVGAPSSSKGNSVSISLTSETTFRQAAEMIAENDNQTATFPSCDESALTAKVRGGTISGASSARVLETLKYRLVTPNDSFNYRVEHLKDRGIYEIQCSH